MLLYFREFPSFANCKVFNLWLIIPYDYNCILGKFDLPELYIDKGRFAHISVYLLRHFYQI